MNRIKTLNTLIAITCIFVTTALHAMNPTPLSDSEKISTIYLDMRLNPVDTKNDAVYYAEMVESGERGYHFQVYFLTGELKMDGWYADSEMNVAQGYFTFYYRSGQIESEGEYRDGYKYGIWKRYTHAGEPKSERIYAFTPMMKAIGVIK